MPERREPARDGRDVGRGAVETTSRLASPTFSRRRRATSCVVDTRQPRAREDDGSRNVASPSIALPAPAVVGVGSAERPRWPARDRRAAFAARPWSQSKSRANGSFPLRATISSRVDTAISFRRTGRRAAEVIHANRNSLESKATIRTEEMNRYGAASGCDARGCRASLLRVSPSGGRAGTPR